jgi:hypothetical protein
MDFVTKRSDSISVSRYYKGYLDFEVFTEMQEAYKENICREDRDRRDSYFNNIDNYQIIIKKLFNFLNTDSDAESYFNEILEQDLDFFGQVKYDDYKDKDDMRFISSSEEFMKSVMTRVTPVTQNPVFEVNYFKLGQISDSIITNMKGIYDYPYYINGYEFADLTFYKENNIVLAVCSHEGFSYLYLSQDEYEGFKKLNLVYSVDVIH